MTNNQVKYIALWKGLEFAINKKIYGLLVFKDSMLVIKQLQRIKEPQSKANHNTLSRIYIPLIECIIEHNLLERVAAARPCSSKQFNK